MVDIFSFQRDYTLQRTRISNNYSNFSHHFFLFFFLNHF